jgi:predicted DNA-binding transcriptional regulator AlpA
MHDDDVLLTKGEVARMLRISLRTLERMMTAGTAPPSITLPTGRRRWRRGDVRQWIDERRPEGG